MHPNSNAQTILVLADLTSHTYYFGGDSTAISLPRERTSAKKKVARETRRCESNRLRS